ncbi:MAG: type II toxin-antitoxin system HicA family toxin [Deltaproteobacteria bacterium]|nr:type II toxin-antitoxin system HicA family toxin [Deltaproteobacteria bacterium]MBW2344236.1 type II toxin-antitoxin system HicA family toxin [Deltaproteobacteria bacterium]
MKRNELLRLIKSNGCVFVRHGGNHDWYRNPQSGISQPIARHTEIEDGLAKRIIKRLS